MFSKLVEYFSADLGTVSRLELNRAEYLQSDYQPFKYMPYFKLKDILEHSFRWDKTNEGYQFWENVANNLK